MRPAGLSLSLGRELPRALSAVSLGYTLENSLIGRSLHGTRETRHRHAHPFRSGIAYRAAFSGVPSMFDQYSIRQAAEQSRRRRIKFSSYSTQHSRCAACMHPAHRGVCRSLLSGLLLLAVAVTWGEFLGVPSASVLLDVTGCKLRLSRLGWPR